MSHRGFCYNSLILTKGQCTLLRGIAILGIVLHNLAHTFPFAVKENEYTFSLGRTFLLNEYAHDIPATLPIQLLSFFGHYGVPIFVFLSGYGLVMKYERTDGKVSTASFLSYNYLKLFRLLVVGYILYLLVSPDDQTGKNVAYMLTMTINMIPGVEIIPGPYWFFGLMIELYLIYRLILYEYPQHGNRQWIMPVALIILAFLSQAFLPPLSDALSKMRYNAFSGIMPFATGVLVARYGVLVKLDKSTIWTFAILSPFIVWVCNYNMQAWLWSWLFVLTGGVSWAILLSKSWGIFKSFSSCLEWIGVISSVVFIIHPIVRLFAWNFINLTKGLMYPTIWAYVSLILYLSATILISWGVAKILKFLPSPQQPKFY